MFSRPKLEEDTRIRSTSTKAKTTVIAKIETSETLMKLLGYEQRVVPELSHRDRFYLVSAHVETSEGLGLQGLLGHLSGHFSRIADYPEGKRIGSKLLLRGKPCDASLIEKLRGKDEVPRVRLSDKKTLYSLGLVERTLSDLVELDEPKRFLSSFLSTLNEVIGKLAGTPLGAIALLTYFLLFFVAPLLSWLGLVLGLEIKDLLIYLTSLVGVFGPALKFLFLFMSLAPALFLVHIGWRRLPDAEKDGLFGILTGFGFLMLGVIFFSTYPSFQTGLSLFMVVGSIIFLNYIYLMGILYPRFRFITVFVFTLTLGVAFLQWIPDFLTGMGIATSPELQTLLVFAFTLTVSVFVGLFYNFMKSIELTLELEHSFALFVGRKGASRATLKQKLGEIMGIEGKPRSKFERIADVVRVYFGFRPQGTIEFHLPTDISPSDAAQPPIEVFDCALYPLMNILFNGDSARLIIKTSSGTSTLEFKGFLPQ